MSLSAQIITQIGGEYSKPKGIAVASFNLRSHPILGQWIIAYTDGTGSGQADLAYMSGAAGAPETPLVITASSFTDLDLNNPLLDITGDLFPLVKLKTLLIIAPTTNLHDLIIGGAAANPFQGPLEAGDKIHVRPGGRLLFDDPLTGWTVTPGSVDTLRIANGGAADIEYHLALIGTSA